ncbi:hypothetical protein N182_28035 [Sinorhizobium sp. GL2]|nr:hypothetical protein N182_28035 [Sinorhizobium sp. GL2]
MGSESRGEIDFLDGADSLPAAGKARFQNYQIARTETLWSRNSILKEIYLAFNNIEALDKIVVPDDPVMAGCC